MDADKKIVIHGNVPSKSNGYKVTTINGHASISKTKAVTDYEKAFYIQCPLRGKNITGYFKIEVDAYLRTLACDLDGIFKVFLDCLQKCGAIKNDNKCVEIVARKFVDKENPRIEFVLEEVKL